jgi:hypothetical protein
LSDVWAQRASFVKRPGCIRAEGPEPIYQSNLIHTISIRNNGLHDLIVNEKIVVRFEGNEVSQLDIPKFMQINTPPIKEIPQLVLTTQY